ncbi:MAG: ubiquinone biosynthesis protein COQ4 [Parvibaculum sp.]|uniref:hypothetical protein n=1 Tax=Parvibaculum sp. TaxID=2024848 RepID=UPI0025E889F3|nr:hypothetical protein [Parvibaculum sp.]MCE9648775.1 ubiquinone biosynthesis protein COQ4 [Parvibaculum sp.]
MQLIHPEGDEALACLRAMRSVTAGEAPLSPAVRAMMTAAQNMLMTIETDLDTLEPIDAKELAGIVRTPGLADQLVGALIVGVLADGEPDAAAYARLETMARALGVKTPAMKTLRLLVEKNMMLFRLDFLRRSHVADMVKDAWRHHGGLAGAAAALLGQRGLVEDPKLAARFTALEALPEDTLGRIYFEHCRSHGFSFPGERGGFPITGAYHDMVHVLSGYGTAPEEELLVGAFTAGFKRTNPFYMILLVSFLWGAGVNVVPVSQPHITGTLGRGENAAKFIHALERGGRVNTDLSDNWDFWPMLPLPLEEARARLGIAA